MKTYFPIAPDSFWKLPQNQIDKLYYGCGPGKFGDFFVPDTIWGLDIRRECQIHDHWYEDKEKTIANKFQADLELLENCIRKINCYTKDGLLKKLRHHRAETYYEMVSGYGDDSYWEDKR